ncbi:hypothetical protein LCGC14_0140790 [marine sediment metagenome]|uniref:Uncharacterized protein n=1 Tax=marine sediment metagenome TaxID=412755 RepID=A0A0F9Y2G0_9ZZZZ
MMTTKDGMEDLGMLPNGCHLYRQPNGAGGQTYYSNECGVISMVWDTCIANESTLLMAILFEKRRRCVEFMIKKKELTPKEMGLAESLGCAHLFDEGSKLPRSTQEMLDDDIIKDITNDIPDNVLGDDHTDIVDVACSGQMPTLSNREPPPCMLRNDGIEGSFLLDDYTESNAVDDIIEDIKGPPDLVYGSDGPPRPSLWCMLFHRRKYWDTLKTKSVPHPSLIWRNIEETERYCHKCGREWTTTAISRPSPWGTTKG